MLSSILDAAHAFITAHDGFAVATGATLAFWLVTLYINRRMSKHKKLSDEKIKATVEGFKEEQKARMWEQYFHEDNKFSERLNFFLVFESVLLGTISALYSSPLADRQLLRYIAVFGLVITNLWFYVQARQNQGVDALKNRTIIAFPEYELAIHPRRGAPFSVSWLLTYFLPLLVAAMWLSLCLLVGL